jgi:DNA-binding NtrC family response regulator
MANHGEFRLDLLYRLNTVTVEVPGLAERPEDIEPLAELFLAEASRATGGHVRDIDEGARRLLKAYAWPGNVRELRNVIERAVILSRTEWITAEDLPESVRGQPAVLETVRPEATEESTPFKDRVRQYEKELILDALRRAEGNQTHAAKILQMPLRTLVHKIKQYGIRKIYDVE